MDMESKDQAVNASEDNMNKVAGGTGDGTRYGVYCMYCGMLLSLGTFDNIADAARQNEEFRRAHLNACPNCGREKSSWVHEA